MTWMALFSARVPTPIEPVAGSLAAGGLDRAGPGELGEGGVAAAASGVGERDDGLGGADRADSGFMTGAVQVPVGQVGGQQRRGVGVDRDVTGLAALAG
jgi:hypothetical protein